MVQKSPILLDTCILSNLLSKEGDLAKNTKELLEALYQGNNTLYISEFSIYELLRGANDSQKKKTDSILSAFEIVPHNTARLKRAIALHNGYSATPQIKSALHSISDVDIFIGSLIFTDQKPYLLTADFFDFPRPFFNEEQIWSINFKKRKGNKGCIHYYLLQANLDLLFK